MDSTPEWHQNEDTARDGDGWLSGVFEMVGCGEEIFSGIDPDAYVRRILINACNSRFRRRRVTENLRAMAELPDTGLADPSDVVGDVRRWWPRCASCRRGSARSWCSVTWRT